MPLLILQEAAPQFDLRVMRSHSYEPWELFAYALALCVAAVFIVRSLRRKEKTLSIIERDREGR